MNVLLLQEGDANSHIFKNNSATATPADSLIQNQQRMNPVLQLIYSRPLPEVVNDKAAVKLSGNEYIRRMYAAGGYSHANYDLRNWTEIRSQLM